MPELPEVETIKLGLEKYVKGCTIRDIEILHPKPFQGKKEDIIFAKIIDVKRIGKGLILELDNNFSIAIHVKMTGQLIYRDEITAKIELSPKVGIIPNKYTHVIFKLSKQQPGFGAYSDEVKIKDPEKSSERRLLKTHKNEDAILYFNDMRRFGWIKVIPTIEVKNLPFFKGVGPEPFKDLTLTLFKKIVSSSPTKIKLLIMDQTKIGGVGNIYANDSLYDAKIDPRRPGKSLTDKELECLYESLIKVLKLGLKLGGSSERSYVNILGQEGQYQRECLVYGKKGEKCKRNDGGTIERIALGGRGTFYCSICQN